ncbi:MAG: AmmeMemoRadiSam system protein A [Desulfobacteraceae bacterium]|nr:AmmeMemoRadiSam system protein A [Desulfobacteraceae bacterium]
MKKSVLRKEGLALLRLARASIIEKLKERYPDDEQIFNGICREFLREKRGVFVTLHKNGKLRGCIGNIEPEKTLMDGVRENAVFAAFKDSRFAPLTLDELDLIDIEISILSKPAKLDYEDTRDLLSRLTPGVDGVIIEKNYHKAIFLPQVWEQLPKSEEFLTHLCMKAGLSGNEWEKNGLIIHTYQVQSFGELDGDTNFTF